MLRLTRSLDFSWSVTNTFALGSVRNKILSCLLRRLSRNFDEFCSWRPAIVRGSRFLSIAFDSSIFWEIESISRDFRLENSIAFSITRRCAMSNKRMRHHTPMNADEYREASDLMCPHIIADEAEIWKLADTKPTGFGAAHLATFRDDIRTVGALN